MGNPTREIQDLMEAVEDAKRLLRDRAEALAQAVDRALTMQANGATVEASPTRPPRAAHPLLTIRQP